MEATIDDPYPERIFLFLFDLITSPGLLYWAYGLLLIFLLLLSAATSGSEAAFFSFSGEQISAFKNSSSRREKRIFDLIRFPKKLLATILILNNLANLAIVILATFIAWQIAGEKSLDALTVLALVLALAFLVVFFGETMPKAYSSQNNIRIAKSSVYFLSFAQRLVSPLAWILLTISNSIDKHIERKGYAVSIEDLSQALKVTDKKDSPIDQKDILKSIVNFGALSVKQIMRSRMDITALDISISFHDLMDKINKSGYSRIPIFRETIDKIEGILYIKDLLPYIDRDEHFRWQSLLRPGYFVPESKKIDDLLKDFQAKRVHMAIVVDEYGGTSGLITMEDIIEEIVGEINDEFDEDEIAFNKLDDNTYIFEGKTSLNDFCKIVGEDPALFEEVKGESESLGGLILELNSKLPRAGDKIMFNKFVFTVVAVDNRRIKKVRVFRQTASILKK